MNRANWICLVLYTSVSSLCIRFFSMYPVQYQTTSMYIWEAAWHLSSSMTTTVPLSTSFSVSARSEVHANTTENVYGCTHGRSSGSSRKISKYTRLTNAGTKMSTHTTVAEPGLTKRKMMLRKNDATKYPTRIPNRQRQDHPGIMSLTCTTMLANTVMVIMLYRMVRSTTKLLSCLAVKALCRMLGDSFTAL